MKIFTSEAEVTDIIGQKLLEVGCASNVTLHSDKQDGNSTARTAIFKTVISLEDSESIVNGVMDIGVTTDRGITYGGSQVEPIEGGEVRYVFFEAKINPNEV